VVVPPDVTACRRSLTIKRISVGDVDPGIRSLMYGVHIKKHVAVENTDDATAAAAAAAINAVAQGEIR
jgi:hypothetical protein